MVPLLSPFVQDNKRTSVGSFSAVPLTGGAWLISVGERGPDAGAGVTLWTCCCSLCIRMYSPEGAEGGRPPSALYCSTEPSPLPPVGDAEDTLVELVRWVYTVVGVLLILALVVVVTVLVREEYGLFRLFVMVGPPPGDCVPVVPEVTVRARKSCLACSADERGRLGAGVGLYVREDDVVADVTADDVTELPLLVVDTRSRFGDGSGLYVSEEPCNQNSDLHQVSIYYSTHANTFQFTYFLCNHTTFGNQKMI